MRRLVVKNIHHKDTCQNEIGVCAQNKDGSTSNIFCGSARIFTRETSVFMITFANWMKQFAITPSNDQMCVESGKCRNSITGLYLKYRLPQLIRSGDQVGFDYCLFFISQPGLLYSPVRIQTRVPLFLVNSIPLISTLYHMHRTSATTSRDAPLFMEYNRRREFE